MKSLANNLLVSEKEPTKQLKDVLEDLQKIDRSRVIVVDASTNKFLGLVYSRTAEAYLAQPGQDAAGQATQSAPSLQTYLNWLNGSGANAKPIIVFLPETASLADVDTKFKESKAKDAIVTSGGTPDSPVIAYINDNDINKYRTTQATQAALIREGLSNRLSQTRQQTPSGAAGQRPRAAPPSA